MGLYLSPAENALVFSADEKTSIQALDRTQPGLPLERRRSGMMTHDYKRNGTTTWFAAIERGHGEVIATCMKRPPRFHVHFIPTSRSWLNIVEGFFRKLDPRRLERGFFQNLPVLIQAIMDYIEGHNRGPKSIPATAVPALNIAATMLLIGGVLGPATRGRVDVDRHFKLRFQHHR